MATENQQARINDVIEVKKGLYLHKTQTNIVTGTIGKTEEYYAGTSSNRRERKNA